ncbi:MAG: GAF domain-containing protein [Anaerolineae bacterium]
MAEVPVGASVLLLVTANRGVRRQVQNVVRETSYELVKTASVELARVYLEERRPLLVLLDFDLIGSADLCMQLSRAGVSVLGLTPDEAEAAAAFSAGVHDYLCYDHKNFSEALRWRIRHVLRGQPAPAPRLPENTRCLVWSALVRQHNTDFQWQVQVHDEENARLFMPLTLTPGQSYTDAWQQSKVVDDLDNTAQVFRNALQNGQKGYHQSFRVQNAKGIRWIFEDVNITPLGDGAWRLVGVCTDVTAYRQDETTLAENDRLRGDMQRLREALDTYKQNEATLQDNESRYLRLIEQASDGIAIMDEEGTLLEMNAQMCDLVGYSHDELKHMNLRDLLQPQGLFEEPIRLEQLAQDDTLVIERPLRRKNGSLVYVEINGRMIEDRHVQCILHDITDRRVAETDLSISQIALQTKTSSLTIINALADTLFRSLEMETVVESAVENIAPYINVDALNLYLYDIRENRLHLVAQRGMPETILRIGDTLPVDGSMTGIAIQTHEMVFSDDLQHDTRLDEQFRSGVMQAAFTTFYGLPVLYQDQVMGALALLFRDKRRLTPEEIETLFSVTRTLGVAVANASYVTKLKEESEQRLRAEAAEREQRLLAEALRDSAAALTSTLNMDEVLERVLEVLMRVLPCDATSIAMIDGNALRVVGARCQDNPALADYLRQLVIPADANNIRWMTEHKQPMFIEDTRTQPDWVAEWQRSYVGAPIIIDDEVIGFLSLDSAQVGSFNQSHVDHLQAFANQVSIAIRNTRYVAQIKAESEQRRRAEAAEREQRLLAETLRESAAFLNSTLYIDEVLEHVLPM